MIAYKVVSDKDAFYAPLEKGVFGSASFEAQQVYYRIGFATRRIEYCGPFACFKSLQQAKRWIKNKWRTRNDLHIFECEVKESEEKLLYYGRPSGIKITHLQTLEGDLPKGTIFCDEVTLIKRILP